MLIFNSGTNDRRDRSIFHVATSFIENVNNKHDKQCYKITKMWGYRRMLFTMSQLLTICVEFLRQGEAFSENTLNQLMYIFMWSAWCKEHNRPETPGEPEDFKEYVAVASSWVGVHQH
jgi:hypothetical protein